MLCGRNHRADQSASSLTRRITPTADSRCPRHVSSYAEQTPVHPWTSLELLAPINASEKSETRLCIPVSISSPQIRGRVLCVIGRAVPISRHLFPAEMGSGVGIPQSATCLRHLRARTCPACSVCSVRSRVVLHVTVHPKSTALPRLTTMSELLRREVSVTLSDRSVGSEGGGVSHVQVGWVTSQPGQQVLSTSCVV